MITVYKITRQDTGEVWHRLSISAMLEDREIPVKVTPTHFSRLAKNGYPVEHSNCVIEKIEALSTSDVRKANHEAID